MRELFFSLGVLVLLRSLDISGWWDIPLVILFLFTDYFLKRAEIKAQGELEAFKLFTREIKHGDK